MKEKRESGRDSSSESDNNPTREHLYFRNINHYPKGGDGLAENFVVEKDGKKYVYRSTSVYDPQTKRKRTVSEYIGRIDPVTGELIQKKSRVKHSRNPAGAVTIRHFGASYALLSVAESCGLREDLDRAFGSRGDYILATAIAGMLSGGSLYEIEPEMELDMS